MSHTTQIDVPYCIDRCPILYIDMSHTECIDVPYCMDICPILYIDMSHTVMRYVPSGCPIRYRQMSHTVQVDVPYCNEIFPMLCRFVLKKAVELPDISFDFFTLGVRDQVILGQHEFCTISQMGLMTPIYTNHCILLDFF